MTKIFLATPAHNNLVHTQYATSLASTSVILKENNIELIHGVISGGSMLILERNRIIKTFLETDCTHILCIDADMGWNANSILGMLKHDKSFVAGLYPSRNTEGYLFKGYVTKEGMMHTSNTGLIKLAGVPAGFMLIRRAVFETIMQKFPEYSFEARINNDVRETGYAFFNTPLIDHVLWGEDFAFCQLVNDCGIDVWCDPYIELYHAGKTGMFAEYLLKKNKELENG